MKVLLAMDSSRGSQIALDEAAARPWPANTEFLVLNVLERISTRFPDILRQAECRAANFVKAAAEKLMRAGYKCESEVAVGAPRVAISECAKQWNADFLMLGSHGHGAIGRFLLGSVAQGVLRTAPCSVEIVRPTASGSPASSHNLKILLSNDGWEFSIAGAMAVASRPWPPGSQIKILSVEELPVFENQTTAFPLAAVYPASLLQELLETARNHAKEAVQSTKKIFAKTDLELVNSAPAPLGDPRVIILEQAQDWSADLMVLGSHGRRGLDRLLLGSVSEAVAIHAKCSVEVIRPDQQSGVEKQND